MVMGSPTAKPAKFLLPEGQTATIAAFFDPGSSLGGVEARPGRREDRPQRPLNIPTGV